MHFQARPDHAGRAVKARGSTYCGKITSVTAAERLTTLRSYQTLPITLPQYNNPKLDPNTLHHHVPPSTP